MQHSDQKFDLIIDSEKGNQSYWKDIFQFKSLFYFLSWRDFLVRYKQTTIGVVWALIRPLLTILVFTYVFGNVAKLDSYESAPYILIVCCGMLPWQFFANAFSEAGNSLINNANLLSKVYFPRIIVPISTIMVSLIDLMISLIIVIVLFIYYNYWPSASILLLPIYLLQGVLVTIGMGCWFASLNVRYRDFRYIIPFVVQFGLYVTPVGFTTKVIGTKWVYLYAINPMVGVIEGCRSAFLGDAYKVDSNIMWISLASTLAILFLGVSTFKKMEKHFADII
ncbi:MAG: hypothetical protein RIQ89_513 [Bacteroidota bacterium]